MHWQIATGAIAMGFAIAAVFFLRFWRETGDRLFALFALAFAVLAGGRVLHALMEPDGILEKHYWLRLTAFLIILAAILDKNRSSRPVPKE
jgi:hypothetical protein